MCLGFQLVPDQRFVDGDRAGRGTNCLHVHRGMTDSSVSQLDAAGTAETGDREERHDPGGCGNRARCGQHAPVTAAALLAGRPAFHRMPFRASHASFSAFMLAMNAAASSSKPLGSSSTGSGPETRLSGTGALRSTYASAR